MKGIRNFTKPNDYGWVTYGIKIEGKIAYGPGSMIVVNESVALRLDETKGEQ
jgi:hypothetical protein